MKINKQELWKYKQKSNGSLYRASYMTLVVRTASAPAGFVPAVRNEARAMDKEQAVFSVATPEELTGDSIALRRFLMLLPLSFTAVALALAAVGVYGVMSYKVRRRVSIASGSERLLVKTSLATARGTDPDNC
jgi:negative regulator of replication initiation